MIFLEFIIMDLFIIVIGWIFLYLFVFRNNNKEKRIAEFYDETPPKFFITGDKHRNFESVKSFCQDINTRKKDVLIILGDSGFNYYDDKRDDKLKKEISALDITLFCLHGNKENRPQNIGSYGIRSFCGGKVYYEPKYPNIFFAIDGEIYNFEGNQYLVVGGAHSVDKQRCLELGLPYWNDEMPNNATKTKVKKALEKENFQIYGIMTHTCPIKYLPTEMFISTNRKIKNRKRKKPRKSQYKLDIDRTTERWLGKMESNITYSVWFCGHYHIDKQIDKIHMLHNDIRLLHQKDYGDNQCCI